MDDIVQVGAAEYRTVRSGLNVDEKGGGVGGDAQRAVMGDVEVIVVAGEGGAGGVGIADVGGGAVHRVHLRGKFIGSDEVIRVEKEDVPAVGGGEAGESGEEEALVGLPDDVRGDIAESRDGVGGRNRGAVVDKNGFDRKICGGATDAFGWPR